MNPSPSTGPASPPAEPKAQPTAQPVEKPGPDGGHPPVSPDDASENTQGNEVREEDLEPSDATESDPHPGSAKQGS